MSLPVAPGDYLINHAQLVTNDLDEARAAVGRMWEYHHSWLRRGRQYGIRWHQAALAGATLSYARTPSALRVVCGPISDTVRITLHESGRLHHRICGSETVSTPRHAVVHAPGQTLELDIEPFSLLILSLDAKLLADGLRRHEDRPPACEDWPSGFALETPAGTALRALCRWTARELDKPAAEIVTSPLAAAHLEQTLRMLVQGCIDEQQPAAPGRADDVTDVRLRRVEDWLDGHLTEPIGVAEMAAVAGVSVRSLQQAFRRRRGCSPMQWLMRRRLEAARVALRAPEPATSVTKIATQAGFFNFGRFAGRYRALFGESPGETLARTASLRRRHSQKTQ